MAKDSIGGLSATTSDEEVRTRAFKFILTNLKYLIYWVATHPTVEKK